MECITNVTDLKGKRVFVRAGLNVPLDRTGSVLNDFRIRKVLPTLQYLKEQGARVIVAAHIGRDPHETLKSVYDEFSKRIPMRWVGEVTGESVEKAVSELGDGEILMIENLRSIEGERENDAALGEMLASYADVYVNDAFSNSHREHASMVGVPSHIPAYTSEHTKEEITELTKALTPQTPSLFLLGGIKFETKQPLIEKFIEHYDHVFVGGALANDFFKGRGFNVGNSIVSDVDLSSSPLLHHPRLLLPADITVQNDTGVFVKHPEEVSDGDNILDVGPETVRHLAPFIAEAQTILWNGPLGDYEEGFNIHTEEVASLIAQSNAYSVVGGGDTVAAIAKLGLEDKISFVSTGGGSMLTFLETGTLPALEALN